MGKEHKLKVVTTWRAEVGEPSPLWRQLWSKLLANKEPSRGTIHETDESEKRKDDGESLS